MRYSCNKIKYVKPLSSPSHSFLHIYISIPFTQLYLSLFLKGSSFATFPNCQFADTEKRYTNRNIASTGCITRVFNGYLCTNKCTIHARLARARVSFTRMYTFRSSRQQKDQMCVRGVSGREDRWKEDKGGRTETEKKHVYRRCSVRSQQKSGVAFCGCKEFPLFLPIPSTYTGRTYIQCISCTVDSCQGDIYIYTGICWLIVKLTVASLSAGQKKIEPRVPGAASSKSES